MPSTLKRIEYSAFRDCKELKKVLLPDGLEVICMRCFAGSCLEELVLPKSVKMIGPLAF